MRYILLVQYINTIEPTKIIETPDARAVYFRGRSWDTHESPEAARAALVGKLERQAMDAEASLRSISLRPGEELLINRSICATEDNILFVEKLDLESLPREALR